MNSLRHLLVVEDSDEDFETVRDAARRAGLTHQLRRALTGDDCLLQLRADGHRPGDLPALVLMDLNTPCGDGRDALLQMRRDAILRAVPVVVLSTSDNPRDVAFCYDSGANAYHVKPVRHADHLRVLEDIFGYWLGLAVLPSAKDYPS